MRLHPLVATASIVLVTAGCRGGTETTPARGPAEPQPFQRQGDDPWKLTWRDPNSGHPALLWNGLIGIRLGPSGSGAAHLSFFAIDEYETVGEERIRPLPNPLAIEWTLDGVKLDPRQATAYHQTLDLKTGLLSTRWAQAVGVREVSVLVETVLNPHRRILADRWTIRADGGADLGYRSGPSDGKEILTLGPSKTTVQYRHQRPGAGGQRIVEGFTWQGAITPTPWVFERVVGITASPNRRKMHYPPSVLVEEGPENDAAVMPFPEVLSASEAAWARRWQTDFEIDGPVADQQAIRSWLFYLRSAFHPDGRMSISPFGLSNERYNGHVFWDADMWVFPALALVDPVAARQIPAYRQKMLKQATANFKAWERDGKPTSAKTRVGPDTAASQTPMAGEAAAAAMYPWESSVSGKETVPGPSRFQHHVTGSVAFGVKLAQTLSLAEPSSASEAVAGAKGFYLHRIEQRVDGLYDLRDTVSVDEFHHGDNDLYTNLVAQWCLNGGNWEHPGGNCPKLPLPRDDETFLTYDGDTERGYKQAAAVLAIYPLQYPPAEAQAKTMMERFAHKTIKGGPAMSDSIHALIWARLGESDRAYETWRRSWQTFATPPHLLFAEDRTQENTYFTTGAAGCLQAVIYGFLGFRIDSEPMPGAAWKTKLEGARWLSVKPNLPKAWKSVTFKNFSVLGKRYTLTATHDTVKVTQGD